MKIQMRIWFEEKDQKVFGEGPYQLLKGVEKHGSLRKAALEMDMSYSKAWSLIRFIEEELKIRLLDKSIGGHDGGGSRITDDARELMEKYQTISSKMQEQLEEYK